MIYVLESYSTQKRSQFQRLRKKTINLDEHHGNEIPFEEEKRKQKMVFIKRNTLFLPLRLS